MFPRKAFVVAEPNIHRISLGNVGSVRRISSIQFGLPRITKIAPALFGRRCRIRSLRVLARTWQCRAADELSLARDVGLNHEKAAQPQQCLLFSAGVIHFIIGASE